MNYSVTPNQSCSLESFVGLLYVCAHLKCIQVSTVMSPFFSYMKGIHIYAGVFKETFGLYSCKCLPVSDASQVLYHFIQQDTLANFLKSAPVRTWLYLLEMTLLPRQLLLLIHQQYNCR